MNGTVGTTIQRIGEFLDLGGPVVTLLIGLSIVSAALVILKLWQFLQAGVGRHRNLDRALAHWTAGGQRTAIADLNAGRSALARIVWQAMATASAAAQQDREALSERLRVEASGYLARLQSGFRALDAIAQVSPLIGLFGTVLGMIAAFQRLQEAGNSVDPSILAGGIWVALLTTAVGLAVAMPTSLLLTFFESRVAREREALERALTIVLNPVRLADPDRVAGEFVPQGAEGFDLHAA
ncbi:MAG: MotA/TolQ/ExbB proton channel family protein [Oricola sp.]